MRNVAIFGKFCAGKSTIAVALQEYGYERVSMAANMKAIVLDAYGTLDKSATVTVTTRSGDPKELTIREILQGIGESVKSVDRDLWLRWFLRDTEYMTGPLVMDDARLWFEASELRKRDWLLVKLDVPEEVRLARYVGLYGRKPKASELNHPTETQVDSIDGDVSFTDAHLVSPEVLAERIVSRYA